MADKETTKTAEAKKEKPKKPSVPNKIVCTKCGQTKGASKDRYLKLLAKEAGIEYESDDQTIQALGGIGSAKFVETDNKVKAKYLCRVCRAEGREAEKKAKAEAKAKAKAEKTPAPKPAE